MSSAIPPRQSSVPSPAVRASAGNVAAAVAVVVLAPPGTSTARVPVTGPPEAAPASDWRFSTQAWTSTSTSIVTATCVSVPSAGSNASTVSGAGHVQRDVDRDLVIDGGRRRRVQGDDRHQGHRDDGGGDESPTDPTHPQHPTARPLSRPRRQPRGTVLAHHRLVSRRTKPP